MAKYRVLNNEELKSLEKEFVEFLVLNGIVASDWEKYKKQTPDKAEGIIAAFSEVVFEKIMRQTHYLETRSTQDWLSFHCQEDQIVLIGISSKSNGIDFTQVDDFKNLIEADLEIFTQSKRYEDNREAEIYGMIENGATISKGESYKQFALVLAELNAKEN